MLFGGQNLIQTLPLLIPRIGNLDVGRRTTRNLDFLSFPSLHFGVGLDDKLRQNLDMPFLESCLLDHCSSERKVGMKDRLPREIELIFPPDVVHLI